MPLFRRRRAASNIALPESGASSTYLFGRSRTEISRLDMQHYMFRQVFHGDYSAPLSTPASILDVACGTGLWATVMATRFPAASIFGFDKNPAQFNSVRIPTNCTLIAGDALERFPFGEGDFDFVMARANSAYVPRDRWPAHLTEMFRVTRPGGWIEVRDFGVVESRSPAVTDLTARFTQLAAQLGIYPGVGPHLAALFARLPLTSVHIQHRQVTAHPRALFARTQGGELMINDYLAVLQRVAPLAAHFGLATESEWRTTLAAATFEAQHFPSRVILTSAIGRKL